MTSSQRPRSSVCSSSAFSSQRRRRCRPCDATTTLTAIGASTRANSILSSVRILAVGNMYPPHHHGGYELVWQAAMREARAQGHEVRVLTSDHREPGSLGEDDPDVHRTLRMYWDWESYDFPRLGLRERVRIERGNAAELRRHLGDFRPDVVAWWSMSAMSLSMVERVRRAGIPAVLVVHDDWLVYGPRFDQWIRMWRGPRMLLAPAAERLLGIPTRVDLRTAGPMLFN